MTALRQLLRENWAAPASVGLHAAVVAGFLIQFSKPAPSLPADAELPSLSVEVMILPTQAPDVVNTAPPPPEPPPPEEVVIEEPPPIIESVAEAAPPEPPPPPPEVKKEPEPEPPKPVMLRQPPRPKPPRPVEQVAETPPAPVVAPPVPTPLPAAEKFAVAAPMGRVGPPPDYASALVSHIKRHHRMPRGSYHRSQRVVCMVDITINRRGKLVDYRIAKPSGIERFDREIPQLMARIDPMPPMPGEMTGEQYSFAVPIEFIVR